MSLPVHRQDASRSRSTLESAEARVLSRTHKAAIILASLTPELASAIVAEIDDGHLQAFAHAFSELNAVPMELLNAVLVEFIAEVRQSGDQLVGGEDEAHRILSQLTDAERVDRVLKKFASAEVKTVWERLEDIEPDVLGDYLSKKKPAVAAAVISRLGIAKTAIVLELCSEEFTRSVLLTLSRKGPPSARVLEEIAAGIEAEFIAPMSAKPDMSGAARFVGEIVNFLPGQRRDAFLAYLKNEDPDIAKEVRRSLLVFEELHRRVPENAVTALTKDLDREILLAALKFGQSNAPETVDFLFANISKRMADQYREELDDLTDLSAVEGESAQRRLVGLIKQMAADGVVKLREIDD